MSNIVGYGQRFIEEIPQTKLGEQNICSWLCRIIEYFPVRPQIYLVYAIWIRTKDGITEKQKQKQIFFYKKVVDWYPKV